MAIKKTPTFWMIWNSKRDLPAVKHWTLKEGLAEGRRLSEKVPGEIFYLLSADKFFFKAAPKGLDKSKGIS